MARISKLAETPAGPESNEEDLWEYGSNRRDVGSVHIDQLTCKASDLARRNLLAVHPVEGWWKSKSRLGDELPKCRYALIIGIDGEHLQAELYAEVSAAIEALIAAQAVITV